MSWSSSLRAGVVPRIQHLKRVNPATIRLASTSSSPPTLVQPSVVSTSASPQQSASQSSHVSIKEDLKRSLQRNSQGAPIEDGLRILIFGKPVSRPLVSETSALLAASSTRPSSYPAGFWKGHTFCSTGAKVRLAFCLHR